MPFCLQIHFISSLKKKKKVLKACVPFLHNIFLKKENGWFCVLYPTAKQILWVGSDYPTSKTVTQLKWYQVCFTYLSLKVIILSGEQNYVFALKHL